MRRFLMLFALLCCGTPHTFAFDNQTAAWKKIILQCATSQLIAKRQVYYIGASNQIGPGSIWQQNSAKGLDFYYPFATIIPEEDQRNAIVMKGGDVNCSGSTKSGWNIKLGLPFSSTVVPLSGDLQVQLSHAKNITLTIDSYAIDTIAVGIWTDAIAALPQNSHHVQALTGKYLAKSGIRVNGLKTTFQFDHDLSADVQAKFQNKDISLGASGTGATLHAELTGSKQITITAPGTSYIMIDLGRITGGSSGAEVDSAMSSESESGAPPPQQTLGVSNSDRDLPVNVQLGPGPH